MSFEQRPRARALRDDDTSWLPPDYGERRRFSRGFDGVSERLREARITVGANTLPLLGAAFEFVALTLVIFEAGALYHRIAFGHLPMPLFYFLTAAALAAIFVLECALARDHSIKRQLDPRGQLRSAFMRWNSAYALWGFALFMLQATEFYSRGSIVAQYGCGLVAALAIRLCLTRLVESGIRSGLIRGRRAVLVGEHALVRLFLQRMRTLGRSANIVDVISIDANEMRDARRTAAALARIERLARLDDGIDDIVLAFSWSDRERIRNYLEGLAAIPATIHLAPDSRMAWVHDPVLARVGGHHTLRLSPAPLTLKDHVIKRVFDVTVALLLLLLLLPLLLLIALIVKIDSPGPSLFRQRRNGFNQHEFRVFKFRTMRSLDDGDVIRQAARGDARETRVGRVLRRTNLDELPQLLNVILGDMSLVGPRPHAVAHNDEYHQRIRLYARRHNVKPGITGWAQVNGFRGETDAIEKMQRRVEHDLYYIDHWSVAFDIKILLLTALSPNSYRNAY
jgi:Undecaprenyl-phosphate glucose phosphotransferase